MSKAFAELYLANVLKIQGFFDDAEFLYRSLAVDPAVQAVALAGLGDLLSLQATWAHEFAAYKAEGVVVNPFSKLNRYTGTHTWHQRSFAEAIDVLLQATALDAKYADAWWLLACACLEAGEWERALHAIRKYMALVPTGQEQKYIEASALFGIDRTASLRKYAAALGGWLGWWHVDDVEIVNAADIRNADGIVYREVAPETVLRIRSNLIRDRQLIVNENVLQFEPAYVAKYDRAEILPLFGMIIANGRQLVGSSKDSAMYLLTLRVSTTFTMSRPDRNGRAMHIGSCDK